MHLSMPRHVKDILLGLLVAYVALDVLLSMAGRHQGMFGALTASFGTEGGIVILVIGLALGFIAYYMARNSTELYTTKKE